MTGHRRLAAGIAAATRKALDGPCGIGQCGAPAVAYAMGTSGRPVGVCTEHAVAAAERGYTVEREPLS